MLGGAVLDADSRARPATLIRRNGQRVTVADVYLRPALHRTNLMVVTESPVVSLALDGWRVARAITAEGIEYNADRFVVCAGAIGTPTLLLRSGLDTPGHRRGSAGPPRVLDHGRARSRFRRRCTDDLGRARSRQPARAAAQPPPQCAGPRRFDGRA